MKYISFILLIFICASCDWFKTKEVKETPSSNIDSTSKDIKKDSSYIHLKKAFNTLGVADSNLYEVPDSFITSLKNITSKTSNNIIIVPDSPTVINAEAFKSFTQSNSFYYVTESGTTYRADILKYFTPGDPNPIVRFRHTNMITNESHTEEYLDYVLPGNKNYRGFIRYDFSKQKLMFVHAMRNGNGFRPLFASDALNVYDNAGCSWFITFPAISLPQFQSQNEIIQTKQEVTCPAPPQDNGTTTNGGIPTDPRYTVNKASPNRWVARFQTYARVLLHTSPGWSPAVQMDRSPNDELIILPHQWVQVLVYRNGAAVWSLATDMDHR